MKLLVLFSSLLLSSFMICLPEVSFGQSNPKAMEISHTNQERMATIRNQQAPKTHYKKKPVRNFFRNINRRFFRLLGIRKNNHFSHTGTPSF
jgi:hypothetical protein